jgi:hypothetical protein
VLGAHHNSEEDREQNMPFILGDQRDANLPEAFRRYRYYLETERHRFPTGALALATSAWYFNPEDHRCPHDAWLQHLVVHEEGRAERHQHRAVALSIQLLGAYHDLVLTFTYPRVYRYAFEAAAIREGHFDWRYDEFRVNDDGRLLHEIEWSGTRAGARWLIEADDVALEWNIVAPSPPVESPTRAAARGAVGPSSDGVMDRKRATPTSYFDTVVRSLQNWVVDSSDISVHEALGTTVPIGHLRCNLLGQAVSHVGLATHRRLTAVAVRRWQLAGGWASYFAEPGPERLRAACQAMQDKVVGELKACVETRAQHAAHAYQTNPRPLVPGVELSAGKPLRYRFTLLEPGGWRLD